MSGMQRAPAGQLLALATCGLNMTVKVTTTMMPVATTMKTKDEQALALNGFRGETLN